MISMKPLRLAALAGALLLGACTASPTGARSADPAKARFDGGAMVGSGNEDGGGGLGSGNFDSPDASVPGDTTTGRGPGLLGTGN
jgi:hypothetical protein